MYLSIEEVWNDVWRLFAGFRNVMGQEETTQILRVRILRVRMHTCVDWTPVLIPWIFASISPRISPCKYNNFRVKVPKKQFISFWKQKHQKWWWGVLASAFRYASTARHTGRGSKQVGGRNGAVWMILGYRTCHVCCAGTTSKREYRSGEDCLMAALPMSSLHENTKINRSS